MANAGYRTAAQYELRPATPADGPSVATLLRDVFGDSPDRRQADVARRTTRMLETAHPCSSVAFDEAGALIGASMAIVRGHLVGLSLAIVREDWQARGVGRALLAGFPAQAPGINRVILSSPDPKAMRRYSALGLELHPTVSACGILRPGAVHAPPGAAAVPPLDGAAALDRIAVAARGEPYGDDIALWASQGDTLHLIDDDAAVIRGGGVLRVAVARSAEAGALAVRAALAGVPPGVTVHLRHLRSGQDWAIREVLAAGLALSPEGPLFSDAPLSPLHLPTGTVF